MGRKIWQSANPARLAHAVTAIVRTGASVDEAIRLAQADNGG
jgi:DhnA family fructose-bisphosphate aldolase class Ia